MGRYSVSCKVTHIAVRTQYVGVTDTSHELQPKRSSRGRLGELRLICGSRNKVIYDGCYHCAHKG